MEKSYREQNELEQRLTKRLMEAEFPGRAKLAGQLVNARVRQIDSSGSFEFDPTTVAETAEVVKTVPVEAEGRDEDGVPIHVLLHVVNGRPAEVEIFKEDNSPIKRLPHPDGLELIVLPPERTAPWLK